jgi:hypothetical protein
MHELAWSVKTKKIPSDRLRLIGMLPKLLAAINQGLDGIAANPVRRGAFLDALMKCHAAALRGELPAAALVVPETRQSADSPGASETSPAPAAGVPEASANASGDGDLLITRSVDNGVEVEEVILVGASPIWRANDRDIHRQVSELKRGDWVEFRDSGAGEGDVVYRERLHWISPQRGILLFSNHRSAKAIAITPDALARQIRDEKAFIVEDDAIFERALAGAVESMT